MLDAGPGELARLSAVHHPFATLPGDELGALLASAEIEFHAAGSEILHPASGAVTRLRIIHSGAVEVARDRERVDVLGPGDSFAGDTSGPGQGAPLWARAAQDTLCYRIGLPTPRPGADQRAESLAQAAGRFRAVAAATPATPWRAAEWLAVDLELTGLNPRRHEIVAIGAVPIRNGRVVLGESFYTLARPTGTPDPAAVLVHGLDSEDLAGAPPIEQALAALLERLTGAVPVFHTAAVERAFLGRGLRRHRCRLPPAADTEALGRIWLRIHSGLRSSGLQLTRLAAVLGQRVDAPHHALGDALMTANAFIALAAQLDARDPETVGSLQGAAARLAGARRFGPG